MSPDPFSEKQGDEIIRLLKKISERLEELNGNTSHLSKIVGGLEQMQKYVFEIWLKS
jgi:hypothetical protein